jgi:hypothetical protein
MKKVVISLAMVALCAGFPAYAQFPGLPPIGGKSKPAASGGDVGAVRSKFFSNFNTAQIDMTSAQLELAKAFDLKDEVRRLEEESVRLKSGVLNNSNDIKGSVERSESTTKALNAKIAEKASMSDAGRAHYLAAIPQLISGTMATAALPKDAQNFADAAKATAQSGSIMEKASLLGMASDAATVAQVMPDFAMNTVELYRKVIAYGQSNNIPLPADATDLLGKL